MLRNFILGTFFVFSFALNAAYAQNITLDYFFNHEVHTVRGVTSRYHYLWTDTANTGFSIWGDIFKGQGADLDTLGVAPTVENLRGTAVYIIVDPDTKKENPNPSYITQKDADQLAKWVNAGGVLVLMANDSANVELPHFNTLAARFGMHFNDDLQNHVKDDAHFSDGTITLNNDPIFKTAKKVFLKDVCSIGLSGNAKPALTATNGAVIAAITKYGKGTVFAVGDPWLYNEYVNGRLPAGYENDKAADDLAKWLLAQVPAKKN
jgi:unsaturated rhamnogalacturonyl hydrolase